jgi:hypothetical protein
MGYNWYKKWQRFNSPNYKYQTNVEIDASHPNKKLLLDYNEAVADLNGYVITQWSANSIDVRNPGDDDEQTIAAVATYSKKLGAITFYESQFNTVKKAVVKPPAKDEKRELIRTLFQENPKPLRLGERSAMVYEIQKLLIEKGYLIKNDGLYKAETINALKSFEEKNDLFPDGKLDAITLNYLLK